MTRPYAFIPSRGGSVRIPRKNLQTIGGYSLVELAVKCAYAAGLTPVVSTDSEEIAEHGRRYGAEIHERPARLARAHSQIEMALGTGSTACPRCRRSTR